MKPIVLKMILLLLFTASTTFSVILRYKLFDIGKNQKEEDRKSWSFYLLMFSAFISLSFMLYSLIGSATELLSLSKCKAQLKFSKSKK